MSIRNVVVGVVLALSLMSGSAATVLAEEAHSHESGSVELNLNNGARWQTDDALRRGMSDMRNDMAGALPGIHGNAFTPAEYTELADKIDGRINYLVENCKLSPEADEQLHVLLVQIIDGIAVMKGDADQVHGAVKIVQALNLYPEYFDHPDWQTLTH